MASAQQLIGLIKSHAEGDEARFFDLAMQLAAAEAQKGHKRLAEQLRNGQRRGRPRPYQSFRARHSPPAGHLAGLLSASYPPSAQI